MTSPWTEIADGLFTRPIDPLELNAGLVVGQEQCLLIETGVDDEQGRELAEQVRQICPLPLQVVNTHAHFDHCFGNAAFRDAPRWGQRGMADWLDRHGEAHRQYIVRALLASGMDALAERVSRATVTLPDRLVDARAIIDLGGRLVHLVHAGRGHSDHDLVVAVPDASLVFWGDLVEVGADPEFGDSYPLEWARTLSTLLDTVEVGMARIAVPGHGDPTGRDLVEELHDRLEGLARALAQELSGAPASRVELVDRLARTGFSVEARQQIAVRVLHTPAAGQAPRPRVAVTDGPGVLDGP